MSTAMAGVTPFTGLLNTTMSNVTTSTWNDSLLDISGTIPDYVVEDPRFDVTFSEYETWEDSIPENLNDSFYFVEEEEDVATKWRRFMEQNHFAQMLLDETIFSVIFGSTWCLFGLIGFVSNIFIFIMMMTKEEREVSQGVYLAALASVDIVLSFAHMFRGGVLISVRVKGIESLMNDSLTNPAGICVTEALENPLITFHAWIIVALMVDSIVTVCFPVQRQMVCTVAKAVIAVITLLVMSFVVEAYTMSHLISTSRRNLADFLGLDYAYKNIKYAFIQHCAHASRSKEGSTAALLDFSFTYAIPLIFVFIASIGLTVELKKRIDKTRTADTYDEANIVLAKICRINRLTITMVCLFAHFLILHAPKGIWVLLFSNIGPPQYQAMPKLEKTIMTEPPKLTPNMSTPRMPWTPEPFFIDETMPTDWLKGNQSNVTDEDMNTTLLETTMMPTTLAPTTLEPTTIGTTAMMSNSSDNHTKMANVDDVMGDVKDDVTSTTTPGPITRPKPTGIDEPWGVNTTSTVPIDPTKGLSAYRFCQTLLCLSHTMNFLILIISSMYYRRLFYLVICHRRVHFGADLSRGSSLSREAIAARLGTPAARAGTKKIQGLKHSSASASFRGPAAKVNFTFNGPPQNLNLNGPSPAKPGGSAAAAAAQGANGDATSPTEMILKEASMKLSTYADKK